MFYIHSTHISTPKSRVTRLLQKLKMVLGKVNALKQLFIHLLKWFRRP